MRYIPLTQGQIAIVDDEDYEELSQFKWYAQKRGQTYLAARTYYENGKKKFEYMHRRIVRAPDGLVVDHINGNGLDNRRSNLRICTRAENNRNIHRHLSRKRAKVVSRFKGVYWDERSKKWTAQIRVNRRQIWLGMFEDEIQAALAYDAAAFCYFGEFARPNFGKGDSGAWPDTGTKKNSEPCSLTRSGSLQAAQIS